MASLIRGLPPHTSLSSETLYFLNSNLSSREDLDGAASLVSALQIQCESLDKTLGQLNQDLRSLLDRHSSHSGMAGLLFERIYAQLNDLHESSACDQSSDGGMGKELSALAKEVARVETVRNYAETALKLDTLVGDIEDAVSLTMNTKLRHPSKKISQDMRTVSLRTLRLAEDVLSSVTKKNPQWIKLVSAVDHRIDRALAILRPQAIADHRALLSSLGWPPPLSTLSSSNSDVSDATDAHNPLFTMEGDLKLQYCDSFLALCGLQELQRRRKCRQLEGQHKAISLHQPLWAIEELVNPISIASQRHFLKWVEKPDYIFALVYKVTRDYVDSMDDLLQPLVDEAMLSGYSCREEWISAMVSSLSTYLAKEIFPAYTSQLNEVNDTGEQGQARASWLNLVDLMIAFDKRVQSLAAHSGMLMSLQEEDSLQKMSSLTVFSDRPDWLEVWADIELSDTLTKLQSQWENDRSWTHVSQGASFLSGHEDQKSPIISSTVLRQLSYVVDRCRSLPSVSMTSRFVKLTALPIIHKFLDCSLRRCQEAEGLTALTDDAALIKVSNSVNAALHFESVLKEWSEDVFFLVLGVIQSAELDMVDDSDDTGNISLDAPKNGIFSEEIKRLQEFRTEWIDKLSTVVLRGFDASSRDYIKNKKQWLEKNDEASSLSRSFMGAMDYLQVKLCVLEAALNKMDFTKVWRNMSGGIDRLLFNSILMGNIKFYDWGVERFCNDLTILFGIFRSWCMRPEGFFPKVSDGLKLLKMDSKRLKNSLVVENRFLKEHGIRHLTAAEVEKIVKNRVFSE